MILNFVAFYNTLHTSYDTKANGIQSLS